MNLQFSLNNRGNFKMKISEKIIHYCKRNRVSTTEVADALGKTGVLHKVYPVNSGLHKVGRIKCVFAANNSNWDVHDQIRSTQENDIVLVFSHNCDESRAILGDLVSKFVLLYLGASAIVVQGSIRDVASLKRQGYAVWSEGVSPLGCHNSRAASYPEVKKQEMLDIYEGAIAVCDDGGVTIINNNQLRESTLKNLQMIELQEDIWFYCLDVLKWDSMKIVCSKDYLKQDTFNQLPGEFRERLHLLTNPEQSN